MPARRAVCPYKFSLLIEMLIQNDDSDEEKKKKLAKLDQLVNKVKDRFQAKVGDVQSKVHQWFRSVKEIEANEVRCLCL